MGKDKAPRHVAVAIVFDQGTKRILMITSRAHPHLWLLPKGGIEDGESSGTAAVRESWEEAGTPRYVEAPTDEERLMMIALEPGASKRPSVWHIHVLRTTEAAVGASEKWPEAHERQRRWFSPSEALFNIQRWYSDGTEPRDLGEVFDEPEVDEKDQEQDGAGLEGEAEGARHSEEGGASKKDDKRKTKDKKQGGKRDKKGMKGGAMETALKTFFEQEGIDFRAD